MIVVLLTGIGPLRALATLTQSAYRESSLEFWRIEAVEMTKVSIIFRALNEEKWFGQALMACRSQNVPDDLAVEIILVDSGSTDNTIAIAQEHGCHVFHINKSEFTFGRSLNIGCENASGDILVFISAHCIPSDEMWLQNLVAPLLTGQCDYTYGGQIGMPGVTRFAEEQVFAHYYKSQSDLDQTGFFCNNANAAIVRSQWEKHRFDEAVTGLEDMVMAKAIVADGGQIGYVANAKVIHIHEETLAQVHRRYFREALTMRDIMPEVHFNFFDFVWCLTAGIAHDFVEATHVKKLRRELLGIIRYRFMQYWGTYRGHNNHRELSRAQKTTYYYPRPDHGKNRNARRNIAEVPRKIRVDTKP